MDFNSTTMIVTQGFLWISFLAFLVHRNHVRISKLEKLLEDKNEKNT